MATISEFIAGRLDEDEAAATKVYGAWRADSDGNIVDDSYGAYLAVGPYGGAVDEEARAHILRHGPARVLRQVAAARAILADHQPGAHLARDENQRACETCGDVVTVAWPCRTVRQLAAAWNDHPAYEPCWAP